MYTRTSGFSHYQRVFLQLESARVMRADDDAERSDAEERLKGKAPACAGWPANQRRGVAQLAEQRSPKPQVAGSSPVAPADMTSGDDAGRDGPGRNRTHRIGSWDGGHWKVA